MTSQSAAAPRARAAETCETVSGSPAAAADQLRSGRIAVVDIGSNSIRLVVFDKLDRAPSPVFNERVLCGLGRGLDETGRLNDDGVRLALTNLVRFARLARAMQVVRLDMLATAAVRDAENGPQFVADVEYQCDTKVTVLSGMSEARLAAMGVISSMPRATGAMGDLGGGSLELVELKGGRLGRAVTLPLGPLRLQEVAGQSREAAQAEIDRHLDQVDWLADCGDASFFPVGGAWRALARIHMEQTQYPLHVIHGYGLPRRTAQDMARVVSRLGPHSLSRIRGVSKRRLETLPYAALLLTRVLRRIRPEQVTFSAFGLREGHLYDLLDPETQRHDPLIAAASELARVEGRFGDLGPEMRAWTDRLFADESAEETRLRTAAGHLADIAWREHPDYRAVQALYRILRLPLLAIDHTERAFLAYTAFIRYGGKPDAPDAQTPRQLMSERQARRAEILGNALRLGITVSGGIGDLLARAALEWVGEELMVRLPEDGSVATGDAMEKRLKGLVKAIGAKGSSIR
jgi:exopolyphosphatase/guanosine-5'-triphosphate,3'-diphosphate pyrophosphatase